MYALLLQPFGVDPFVRVLSTGDKWAMNAAARSSSTEYICRKIGVDNYVDCTGLDKANLAAWPKGLVATTTRSTDGLDCYIVNNHVIAGLIVTTHVLEPVVKFVVVPIEGVVKSKPTEISCSVGWNKVLPELKEKIIKRIPLPVVSSPITFGEELAAMVESFNGLSNKRD